MNQLGEAFSFAFRDKAWVSKFIIGAVFMLLCILIVGIFILAGYFVQVTQRVMRKDPNPLPDWDDIGVKLVVGFKFCVVYLIYSLPIIILYVPFIVMTVLSGMAGGDDGAGFFAGMFGIGFMFLIIPYTLALYMLLPIITYRFAERESIGDALDIAAIVKDFKRNWANTLIVALIAVGIQYFAMVGIVFFLVGVFFTIMYAYLVSSFMFGALYLERPQEGIVVT
ncbi:MAG: DUF4013 domain-containing protein [Bacteroidota bacterium]